MVKKISAGFILVLVVLAVSCELFFSKNTGEEEGNVTLSLDPESIYTGAIDGSASFEFPAGDTGDVFPDLGDSRVVVYDSAGKALRTYTVAPAQGSLQFSVPAGGPYWVEFSAAVPHPAQDDPFPFVKSFGATVKLDAVDKGSSQELFLPLRVRETAIMAPYMPAGQEVKTDVFVPFYDLPDEYPAASPRSIDKGAEEICFDFDPFGRLFTMGTMFVGTGVYRIDNFSHEGKNINILPSLNDTHGLAFNMWNGHLYYAYRTLLGGEYTMSEYQNTRRLDTKASRLSSTIITIDEGGTLYGLTQSNGQTRISAREMSKYWETDLASIVVNPAVIKELLDFNEEYDQAEILDLKALNGYLYALLYVKHEGKDNYNDYFAAIPLESVKKGTVAGSWFAGGPSVDELPEGYNTTPRSREGFFGPKKFVGWGPDRIYIYDDHGASDGFYRIVEVDLRNRGISKAGLVVDRQQ